MDQTSLKLRIKETVAKELPLVKHALIRTWLEIRVIEPRLEKLAIDDAGTCFRNYWIVIDHKEKKGYRIAYSPDTDSFGLVTSLKSGIEWYMGDYGSFRETAENI